MRMAPAASGRRARLVTSATAGGSVEGAMGRMSDDLSQASDAALVVAIGRWRQEALAEAYLRHAGAVFALANRVLGSRPVGNSRNENTCSPMMGGSIQEATQAIA